MLLFSDAKITVRESRVVRVEGFWQPFDAKIRAWIPNLGLGDATIRLRGGRILFSRGVDAGMQQRLRNFLFNECK